MKYDWFHIVNRSLPIILENSIHYLVIENIWRIKCFTLLQQPLSEKQKWHCKKSATQKLIREQTAFMSNVFHVKSSTAFMSVCFGISLFVMDTFDVDN